MQRTLDKDDLHLCLVILGASIETQIEINLSDVFLFVSSWKWITIDEELAEGLVQLCGSFLTLREKVVVFVHPSAKEWLMNVDDMHSYIKKKKSKEHIGLFFAVDCLDGNGGFNTLFRAKIRSYLVNAIPFHIYQ